MKWVKREDCVLQCFAHLLLCIVWFVHLNAYVPIWCSCWHVVACCFCFCLPWCSLLDAHVFYVAQPTSCFRCAVFLLGYFFLRPISVSRSHMEFEKDKAGRNKLQNYVLLPLYLTLSLWQELMDPSLSFEFVLASLSNHCVMLGLKFPSESTCGMVYTLLNFRQPMKFNQPPILFQDYVQVKNAFKASLFRVRTSLQVIPGAYLLELPPVWQDLPMDMLDKFFGNEAPCEPKFPMKRLQSLQQSIPLRQSHRLVDTKLPSQTSTPAWLGSIVCALSKMSGVQEQFSLEYPDGQREALPAVTQMAQVKDNGHDSFHVAKCLPLASSVPQEKVVEKMPVKTEPAPSKPIAIMDKAPEVSWFCFFHVFFCVFFFNLFF